MVQCTLCTRVFNSERASVRYVVVVPDECGNTIPLLQHKAAKHSLSNRHNISISGNVIRSGVTAEPRHLPLPAQSHCGKCDLLFANDDARDNHWKDAHPQIVKCCSDRMMYVDAVEQHYLESPLHPTCFRCRRGFKDDASYDEHRSSTRPETRCRLCKCQFDRLDALLQIVTQACRILFRKFVKDASTCTYYQLAAELKLFTASRNRPVFLVSKNERDGRHLRITALTDWLEGTPSRSLKYSHAPRICPDNRRSSRAVNLSPPLSCAMAFRDSRYTDASFSTFNDVGGDHITIVHNNNIFIPGGSAFEETLHHLHNTSSVVQWPTSGPEMLSRSQGLALVPTDYSGAGDAAARLIIQIVPLLMNPESSDHFRNVRLELKCLQQTFTLSGLAIQTYKFTPLGQRLTKLINQEIERCRLVLQELLDAINGYRQSLNYTRIRSLWRQVWWSGCEADLLVSFQAKLSAHQRSLGECLMALDSISWQEHGNGLRAGHVSLKDFHALLRRGPVSLQHIQVNNVLVVDHLGRNIPVPTMFCSRWEDFNYVINGYCKDRAGNRFIERGDYQIIRAEGSRVIGPSAFARTVEPGMVLEISIILRQATAFQKDCPRCGRVNSTVTANGGWIECTNCSGQFQVSTADQLGENDRDGNEEIISPASRPRANNDHPSPQTQDDDDTQFFRRIHVVCPKAIATLPGSVTYTTLIEPDGRIIYYPFRAVTSSYQTPYGIVRGLQWVPAEATRVLPSGAQPANAEFVASWNRHHGYHERSDEKIRREEEKRRKREEKEAAKQSLRMDEKLRKGREQDARANPGLERRRSFS